MTRYTPLMLKRTEARYTPSSVRPRSGGRRPPDGSRKPPPGGPFVAAPAGPFKVRDSLASVAVVGRQRRVRERGHIARYGELTRR